MDDIQLSLFANFDSANMARYERVYRQQVASNPGAGANNNNPLNNTTNTNVNNISNNNNINSNSKSSTNGNNTNTGETYSLFCFNFFKVLILKDVLKI